MDTASDVLTRNGLDDADIGWAKRSLKTDGASMRDVLETVARLLDAVIDADAATPSLYDARAILALVLR